MTTTDVTIASVVEGHGEVTAVPILIRRIAQELAPGFVPRTPHPIRTPRSKLVRPGEIERAVELAARKAGGVGGVLVLIDADDDCPAELGPELLQRARAARGDLPLSVVLARREYEAWFLAAAESLRGKRGLPADLSSPPDPEAIRGAKSWLGRHMGVHGYSETLHQPPFTAGFDIAAACLRARSFAKCRRDIQRLLREARQAAGG